MNIDDGRLRFATAGAESKSAIFMNQQSSIDHWFSNLPSAICNSGGSQPPVFHEQDAVTSGGEPRVMLAAR
jgi:hypothetical protein